MRPAISIDFGAAYTKIALRKTPNSTATLLSHEKLNLDEDHVCIPTIAAWRETDDRWVFGADAADLKTGNGIHVFRNWKPVLFAPPGDVLDPDSSIGKLFYYNLEVGSDEWPPIKKLAVKYFEWIIDVMLPGLLGYEELEEPVIRISIPEFAGETLYAHQMEEILIEAGWPNPWIFCEPEPMTNLAGALSQGKNQMITDESGMIQPDINTIFMGSGMIDYIDLTREKDVDRGFSMLMIDVGAYTTDFALVTIEGGSEGGLPPLESHSEPYGIEMLDNLVKHGLPDAKSEIVANLTATDREAFRRNVYSENRAWNINDITLGDEADREVVEKCINGMATRIVNEIERFMTRLGIKKIDEVVFTGGGTNIPRITMRIAERLLPAGVETFHSASLPPGPVKTVKLAQQVVRGASALGGASVLFGDE